RTGRSGTRGRGRVRRRIAGARPAVRILSGEPGTGRERGLSPAAGSGAAAGRRSGADCSREPAGRPTRAAGVGRGRGRSPGLSTRAAGPLGGSTTVGVEGCWSSGGSAGATDPRAVGLLAPGWPDFSSIRLKNPNDAALIARRSEAATAAGTHGRRRVGAPAGNGRGARVVAGGGT